MVLRRKVDNFDQVANGVDEVQLEKTLAERLSAAVAIPTPVYDTLGRVGEDQRWTIFGTFNKYLAGTFPLAHQKLNLITINKYGLLYTWAGHSHELKPLLLMAHSDVVPADTSLDLWTHPPFSGKIDGGFVWGRGSEDDKSNLIAMLSVIEHLLDADFVPTRTILLAVGFDEEGGSDESQGAAFIAAHLLELYGPNGIEMVFDEGVASIENRSGTEIALPATSEKGYLDITVIVNTPGGHSSLPPRHTSVGILAQAVCLIEDRLLASDDMEAIVHPHQGSSTTVAVTMAHGGDKVNSLPENAWAVINHRIGQQDTVQRVKALYVDLISPLARQHGLEFVPFRTASHAYRSPMSSIVLTDAYALDPSPVTDISRPCFSWLSSATRKTFGSDCRVQPTCLDGNTDTRYYWDLSESIYRMSPWRATHDPRGTRMHTVDERMPTKGLLEMYRFYKELIFASALES